MSNGSVSEDWLGRLMGVQTPWRVTGASAPEGDAEGFVEIEVGHGGGPLSCLECGKSAKRLDISWNQASAVQSRAVERGGDRRSA